MYNIKETSALNSLTIKAINALEFFQRISLKGRWVVNGDN